MEEFINLSDSIINKKITRKKFLKGSALLGGSALLLSQLENTLEALSDASNAGNASSEYALGQAENLLYTSCLQCNTGCGLKVKLIKGLAVKLEGNPVNPWTMTPQLPYKSDLDTMAGIDGAICPKGQAALQTLYDPYRIVKVLKRTGPRGSNKWESIPFDKAISEVVEGGSLFANIGEDRHVEGLKDIYVMRNAKLAKKMAKEVKALVGEKDKTKKQELLAKFKEDFKDHLHLLIDPNHPDLGTKNNQLVFMWGRMKAGRSNIVGRFVKDAFGSVNAHGHTTVCQGSLYFTGKAMSYQWDYDEKDEKMKWTKEKKFYWQADTEHAEFIIFVGASPLEANYGPPLRAGKLAENIVSGKTKIAVIDPRFSKTASKAYKWVPAIPGSEGAFAMGMIRWVLENHKYDARFLSNANQGAAKADDEPSYSNSTWLVKIEKGKPGAFLRGSDLGLAKETRTHVDKKKNKETSYEFDSFIALKNGAVVAFDPNSDKVVAEGDLYIDTEIKGIKVKSVMQLLLEEAKKHTIEEYAKISGVEPSVILELASEFVSHGKKAVADIHRGVSQHTNGFYNVYAWYSLNLLIGNFDWKGGLSQLTTYNHLGEKKGQPIPLKDMVNHKTSPFGVDLIRQGDYEKSTLYNGKPAKRMWYPIASDVYEEIIPSMDDAYPYPIKALISYMAAPTYSLPAGHTNIEILVDTKKVPLHIANDITVGVTSMYADYIFPDLSFLERWEFQGSHPNMVGKVQPIRQPVVAPLTETVKVFGEDVPICLESLLMGLAEKLELPTFGKDGFEEGVDFKHPDDLYLRMVANVAYGEKEDGKDSVPDADEKEIAVFIQSRKHLPKQIFDLERMKRICGDLFPKVVYVLNRGGRFQDHSKFYEGDHLKNKYGKLINMYSEKVAKSKNAMTGKGYKGLATYMPIADCLGNPIEDEKLGFDLKLITYREISQCKSRTSTNYWLLGLMPENFILMNQADAHARGLSDADKVRVTSATNPDGVLDLKNGKKVAMVGKVKVTEGIRPGVVAFSLGHGNWATGTASMTIDGKRIAGDKRRGKGIHCNPVMRIDPVLKNTCLLDPVGGSVSFYDTMVKIKKA